MTDLTIILLACSTVPVHCGFGKNYDETMLELTRIIGYVQCIFKIKEGGEIIYLNKKRLREPLRHSHQHIQLEGREIFHYFREKHTYTFNPTFTRLTRLYWYKLHVQCFFRIAKESGDITSQK